MTADNSRKKLDILVILLIIGACLIVAVKELFVGFSADEEYQLVLCYRLAHGDSLFSESWDTLQTSAFYGQFLMWIFLKVFRTSAGSLLFLRLCGIITQAAVSVFLYTTVKKFIKPLTAGFIAAGFFCTFTKLVSVPEFANLQTWGLVLTVCCIWRAKALYEAEETGKANGYIVAAALSFCVAVLAAACIIVVPVIVVMLARLCAKGGVRRNLLFFGSCAVTGLAYVGIIVGVNGLDRTLFGIRGMIYGDDTHLGENLLNGNSKVSEYLRDFGTIGLWLAVTLAVAVGVSLAVRIVGKKKNCLWMPVWIFEGFAVTLYNWFVRRIGYEGLKLYIPVILIIGIVLYVVACREKTASDAKVPFYGILMGILAFVNVLFISNVGVVWNITFLNTCVLWGLVIFTMRAEKADVKMPVVPVAAAFMVMMAVGTTFTLNAGPMGSTVFALKRPYLIKEGPAKGTMVSKDVSYVYNINTELFESMIKENSSVLIVTNFFHNQSLSALYMVNDVNISHYTVNSTPTYGDTLYEYWEEFPEKRPDAVILNTDSCTGDDYNWTLKLLGDTDEWIQDSLYSVYYYVKPECVKEEYKASRNIQ